MRVLSINDRNDNTLHFIKNMNIEKLIWDYTIPFTERLKALTDEKMKLDKLITNRKKLVFNIYYNFPKDLSKIKSDNQKWKIIVLAIEVLKIVKRWNRKYEIDMSKVVNGKYFVDYFKNSIDTSKFNLCSIGINFYHRNGYTFKTLTMWANKICKLGIISNDKFNAFMEKLERSSNGR